MTPQETTTPRDRLHALCLALKAHAFDPHLATDRDTLSVENPDTGGRGVIVCRPRPDDADVLWYWWIDGQPIAQADSIVEALVIIKGRLAGAEVARRG